MLQNESTAYRVTVTTRGTEHTIVESYDYADAIEAAAAHLHHLTPRERAISTIELFGWTVDHIPGQTATEALQALADANTTNPGVEPDAPIYERLH